MLVGAPTGSGKTAAAELCILRLLNNIKNGAERSRSKVVYVAPIKALARERVLDWKQRFSHLCM